MIPQNEPQRLDALRRYQILDTPPNGTFDHITAVVAHLFRVPIALVSLVDHNRIGLSRTTVSAWARLGASIRLGTDGKD
jgi:predicted component of type VI protein secretion system